MAAMKLNATAASLLGFLLEGPMAGWDLVATARQRIGEFWSLTQSQVYRELTAMEKLGLVEAGERGRRDRRPYAITDAGRAAFADWIEHEPGPESIRFPLLLTVGFGRHLPPERLTAFLETHRSLHAARLAGYEDLTKSFHSQPAGPGQYAMATLTFGIEYERAVLRWFDGLPAILGESLGGTGAVASGDAHNGGGA